MAFPRASTPSNEVICEVVENATALNVVEKNHQPSGVGTESSRAPRLSRPDDLARNDLVCGAAIGSVVVELSSRAPRLNDSRNDLVGGGATGSVVSSRLYSAAITSSARRLKWFRRALISAPEGPAWPGAASGESSGVPRELPTNYEPAWSKRGKNVREGGREGRDHGRGREEEDGNVEGVHQVIELKCMSLRERKAKDWLRAEGRTLNEEDSGCIRISTVHEGDGPRIFSPTSAGPKNTKVSRSWRFLASKSWHLNRPYGH